MIDQNTLKLNGKDHFIYTFNDRLIVIFDDKPSEEKLTAIGEIGKTLDNNITKWVRCFYQSRCCPKSQLKANAFTSFVNEMRYKAIIILLIKHFELLSVHF